MTNIDWKWWVTVMFLTVLLGSGCSSAEKYLGSTKASYTEGNFVWDSNKNQENLNAKYKKDGEKVEFQINTTATTPEAAMAAAALASAEAWKNMSEFMKELLPLLKQGAMSGS